MKEISQAQFVKLFEQNRGAEFACITTHTFPALLRTGNPWPKNGVVKLSKVNVCINWNYANSVNNQREREGNGWEFEPEPRTWGERLKGLPFVQHKGKMYLEAKVEKSLGHEYFEAKTGKWLDPEAVAPFLPKKSNKEHQGVKKEILLRDYKLESIKSIRMRKEDYILSK